MALAVAPSSRPPAFPFLGHFGCAASFRIPGIQIETSGLIAFVATDVLPQGYL